MALKKLSRSYGTSYAGLTAVLTETQTNMPVTVYASESGAYPSRDGSVKLDSSGGFSVWADDQKQYTCRIYSPSVGVGISGLVNTDYGVEVDAASTSLTPEQVASGYSEVFGVFDNQGKLQGFVPSKVPGAQVQSPVSGDTVVADFAALLALPVPADGQTAVVVAPVIGTILTGGIPRTRWVYIGGDGWRLDGQQALVVDHSLNQGALSTSEQALKTYSVPARLLLRLRTFNALWTAGKTGVTDSITLARVRVTTAGALTSNNLFATSVSVGARASTLSASVVATANTTLRHTLAATAAVNAGGTTTASSYPNDASVADMSSETVIVFAAQMAGTTDAPIVGAVRIQGE